jgi:hypothetical protein
MSLKNGDSACGRFGQLKNKYVLGTNEDLTGPSDQKETRHLPPATAGSKRKSEVRADDTDDEEKAEKRLHMVKAMDDRKCQLSRS